MRVLCMLLCKHLSITIEQTCTIIYSPLHKTYSKPVGGPKLNNKILGVYGI